MATIILNNGVDKKIKIYFDDKEHYLFDPSFWGDEPTNVIKPTPPTPNPFNPAQNQTNENKLWQQSQAIFLALKSPTLNKVL